MMTRIKFREGTLSEVEQSAVSRGFERHSAKNNAPAYQKRQVNWVIYNDKQVIIAALTADILWDWLYVDELWVDESMRGQGYGKKLMNHAERCAIEQKLSGIWLWTQSWQAADFYQHQGYQEFTQFPDFPKGHFRIGLRKFLPA